MYCLCCQTKISEDAEFCSLDCRELWLIETKKVESEMEDPMDVKIMLNPEKYGYKECDHCNGCGSSLQEDADRCTECGGTGLVESKKKVTEESEI